MSTNDRTPEQERVYLEQYQRFRALINASKAEELRLRPEDPEPNFDDILAMYGTNEPTEEELAAGMTTVNGEPVFNLAAVPGYVQRLKLRREASKKRRDEWEAAGSDDWKAAKERTATLYAQFYQAEEDLDAQFRRENFATLNGDREKILDDARQIASDFSITFILDKDIPVPAAKEEALSLLSLKGELRLHYDFFAEDPSGTEELDTIAAAGIRAAIRSAPKDPFALPSISTRRPKDYIAVMAKVAESTFSPGLTQFYANVQEKSTSKTKPVRTLVTINFDEIAPEDVRLRNLTPFDRAIHDAIVSLSLSGNEYITENMVFDTVTGTKGKTLNPRQRQSVAESITKLMYSRITIDATEEAKAFGVDMFTYDAAILPAERVRVSLNGQISSCIHLFRTPPLYEYANRLNQVQRANIALLSSPVQKTEEMITLQDYLFRRIIAMKGGKLSRNIKYDTLYSKLNLSAASPGALRKKQMKIRDAAEKILDYWQGQTFIKGHEEIKEKGRITGVTIWL